MSTKQVDLEGVGPITLYKRRGAKTIRLSINSLGKIRVTMPTWVPYSAGISFAKQKADWLRSQIKPREILADGARIGQQHHLRFETGTKLSTRVLKNGIILVRVPEGSTHTAENVQAAAIKASVRALRREAEEILPGRLCQLANEHGFDYRSVEVKQLKSRWGSCNHRQEIVLNCFLMQLPDHLINYVLLHELMHTKILAHGPCFWSELGKYVTNLPAVRKEIRQHQPTVKEVLQTA